MQKTISILGAGPAGSAAAIAASRGGCAVRLIEKSRFPRHKVCGEFFSPEIERDLDRLGVWSAFAAARPALIRRMRLHFGQREKAAVLQDRAWGLSRYAFDHLLLQRAIEAGSGFDPEQHSDPDIVAWGRQVTETSRGRRLFGFKAHFSGPVDDAVELYFFHGAYVGLNPVENGVTNICGLAPEEFLRRFDFDFDAALAHSPALAQRVKPLTRELRWLTTGPLRFEQNFEDLTAHRAGDALSFVDPFTGSGLLAAVRTGSLAGEAVAHGDSVQDYLRRCRSSLRKPFEMAALFRKALNSGLAETLAPLIPSGVLFALTRPR